MKKFIAIILALITVFSMVTVGASAYTTEQDGIWVGVENDTVYADPGKTIVIPISVAAKLEDADLTAENVDKASAVLTIPFSLSTDAMSPIQKFELTDAAKTAGATAQLEIKEGVIDGKITLPLSALKGNDSMVVLNVEVKMDEKWEVKDYKAVSPVAAKVCEKHLLDGVTVADKDEHKITAKLVPADFVIKATPYDANFIEKAFEWIKSKIRAVLVLFQTLNTYLLSDPLEAPDWVKQEENRAARDAKEAQQVTDVA